MINLNKTLNRPITPPVKPREIHNFIHRFCGKLWKSPKYKHFDTILNAGVYFLYKGLFFSDQWCSTLIVIR